MYKQIGKHLSIKNKASLRSTNRSARIGMNRTLNNTQRSDMAELAKLHVLVKVGIQLIDKIRRKTIKKRDQLTPDKLDEMMGRASFHTMWGMGIRDGRNPVKYIVKERRGKQVVSLQWYDAPERNDDYKQGTFIYDTPAIALTRTWGNHPFHKDPVVTWQGSLPRWHYDLYFTGYRMKHSLIPHVRNMLKRVAASYPWLRYDEHFMIPYRQ